MKTVIKPLQDTMVRGVFLLVPLMVFGMLIGKALGMLRTLLEPIAKRMGDVPGISMPVALSIVVLVTIVLLAGLLSKLSGARGMIGWLESTVLSRIPGYAYMKGMGENAAGVEGGPIYQPVLARIEDSWQLGFIVETIEPGQYAVYVPGAPNPWSGSVYFMAESRLRKIDLKLGEVQGCLKRLGIGSSALLRGKLSWAQD